ncbi:uncharacterized protein FOMMEDRAFT_23423 [Fomitiporia mediterranea MF3/22]|uniref:uncharacterized protein n=1 Tax=Fomitiporia mediterranea (strain MF3/22) TaxID=694068 RepID=UPI00044086A3|nr:uncharacterized protein FOMMEDRAFT_23423 [Fomitiporia mediterranea MF3/22]EJC98552.1 hypothetical protein FOMMEDRAFT_23423 [Fomitiporia mediterranea MF3/22]
MPRAATQTATKAATRTANTKTKKGDGEGKAKRAPSAYNVFMGEQLKIWKENNPGTPIKEGMAAVAALWRESPQNPKRGQAPAEPKAKKAKADKENAKKPSSKKPKSKASKATDEDEGEQDEE